MDYVHLHCWGKLLQERHLLMKKEDNIVGDVEDYLEKFSPYSVVKDQVDEVLQLLLAAKRTVYFTGAGVSASSGIPTYRGADGIDTLSSLATTVVVKAVVATSTSLNNIPLKKNSFDLTDMKNQPAEDCSDNQELGEEDEDDVDYTKLQPTYTHLSLVKLRDWDKLFYVITQNCDNLHQKAGLAREHVSDPHGNVFIEYCESCSREYERDYCVDLYSTNCYAESWYRRCRRCGLNHFTGRHCEKGSCKGKLKDTIVNFKDNLHDSICGGFRKAETECEKADLCFCLGSSLSVYPAANLPMLSKKRIIINLQSTELDGEENTIRIWATTDSFFQLLMLKLEKVLKQECGKTGGEISSSSSKGRKRNMEIRESNQCDGDNRTAKETRQTTTTAANKC
jgi:mono-ADP-ribosyltransferase sirtuin 6